PPRDHHGLQSFPTRTLFRSRWTMRAKRPAAGAVERWADGARRRRNTSVTVYSSPTGGGRAWRGCPTVPMSDAGLLLHLVGGDDVDRKSTRLNSSHVKISYAV